MRWLEPARQWIESNDALLWWLFAGSVALLLLSPIAVAWVLIRLPKDYFTLEKRRPSMGWIEHPRVRPVVVVVKNVLGAILLVAGVAMLFLPGQGLLTIAVGVMLTDFPGKRRLERWLITRRAIWRTINWLRRRAGRDPLRRPRKVA
jgi:Putative transmembrane protein (PGPGW)